MDSDRLIWSTLSSTPVTVTVWGVLQLVALKVNVFGLKSKFVTSGSLVIMILTGSLSTNGSLVIDTL